MTKELRILYDQCASCLRQAVIKRDYQKCVKVLNRSRESLYHDLFKKLITEEIKTLSELDRLWWDRHFSLILIDGQLDYV
jgi:hypothetical protein